MKKILFGLGLMLLIGQPAFATTVAGVKLADKVEIGNEQLQLNGYGIRKKFFFKIYIGSLYTAHKATSSAQVLADNGGKLIRMDFLYHKVDKQKIVDGFAEGIEKNTPQLRNDPAVKLFLGWFNADFLEGDQVDLAIDKNNNVSVSHNGRQLGSVQSDTLAKALLLIYLGNDPADDDMKEGMLRAL